MSAAIGGAAVGYRGDSFVAELSRMLITPVLFSANRDKRFAVAARDQRTGISCAYFITFQRHTSRVADDNALHRTRQRAVITGAEKFVLICCVPDAPVALLEHVKPRLGKRRASGWCLCFVTNIQGQPSNWKRS